MNVAMPSCCWRISSTHFCAVLVLSTTMLSSAPHAVETATSNSGAMLPSEPSRPMTPGIEPSFWALCSARSWELRELALPCAFLPSAYFARQARSSSTSVSSCCFHAPCCCSPAVSCCWSEPSEDSVVLSSWPLRSTDSSCAFRSRSAVASSLALCSSFSASSFASLPATSASERSAASDCALGSRSRCFASILTRIGSVSTLMLSYISATVASAFWMEPARLCSSSSSRGRSCRIAPSSACISPCFLTSFSVLACVFLSCALRCLSSSRCLMSSRSKAWNSARLVSSCAAVLSWSRFDFLCAFSRVDSFSVLSLAFSRSSAWRASSSERVCSTSSTLAWLCWAYFWYIAARFSLSCASVRMNCSASVLLPSSCCI
mmetsp:Transcript_23020/g.54749  ORF Transcript_23020/g.54749 Transcript_23020/m.54749 type:complete len:376 (+) Transcript_23020:1198-2325(+)